MPRFIRAWQQILIDMDDPTTMHYHLVERNQEADCK
jgi:hypothetical protein